MSSAPAVIVKKGGFLASVAKGVFGSIMVIVICATVLVVYGLRTIDHHVVSITQCIASAWPEWQKALPAVLADAVNDRRAPEYGESVSVSARVARAGPDDQPVLVSEAANKGTQTVSLLALHVVLEDEHSVPMRDFSIFAATPLVVERDWRGPLLPGKTRQVVERLCGVKGDVKANVEMTELRVWTPPAPAHADLPSPHTEQVAAESP